MHVGLYNILQGEDANLEGMPRTPKASFLCTKGLLSRCFPEPLPDTGTLMELGCGYGGMARAAAKEFGCKVRGLSRAPCPFLIADFGASSCKRG